MNDFTVVAPLLTAISLLVGGLITWKVAKRNTSGTVATSDAKTVFDAAEQIRLEQRADLTAVRDDVKALRAEVAALRLDASQTRSDATAAAATLKVVQQHADECKTALFELRLRLKDIEGGHHP